MSLDILQYKSYLKLNSKEGKSLIFDRIRKKYVAFTPEEMVRQLFIEFLIRERKIPEKYIAVEKQIHILDKNYRFDILVFNKKGQAVMIVECKSHKINISDKTALQISKYNYLITAPYLCLTNGKITKFFKIDFDRGTIDSVENFDLS